MLKSHYRDVAENQDKHWWYLGMAAVNKALLDSYLPKKRNLKILDAGCGPGAMLPHLAKYGDVIGVDLSDEALKYARKRGKVERGDITKLNFKDETFDLVICLDVLYHLWVKDEMQALRELNRVLKPGGTLLLREPAYNWLRGNEDRGSLTARRFSKQDLKQKLRGASFKVQKISFVNFFLLPMVLAVRLMTALGSRKGSSDLVTPPNFLNQLLLNILKFESSVIKDISFPFGSSLISMARKMDARERAINLYTHSGWENFLSNFKFWEEPYEVVEKMLPASGTIVELGCGEGLLTNYLALAAPRRKIIGYEIVPERLELAKKGIKNTIYRVGDIVQVPFPKAEVFILFHVLHHLPGKEAQEKVLAKVKKNLKRGGKLIIVDVHVGPTIKYLAAWIADHFLVPWVFEKRFFTRAYFRTERQWLSLLKRLGYKVKVTHATLGRPFPNIIFECIPNSHGDL